MCRIRMQACAGTVSTNKEADAFWLNDAQHDLLANEHGPDASPFFMGSEPRIFL